MSVSKREFVSFQSPSQSWDKLTSELDVIVMFRLVDSLNGTSNVEFLDRVVEVVNSGVSQIVGTEDLLGFLVLVGLVDG